MTYLLFFLLPLSVLNAQIPPQIFHISNTNSVSVEKLDSDLSGHLLFAGLFDEAFELDGFSLPHQGENDIYISKRNGETLLWAKAFGSSGQDEILALTSDTQNNIYIAGSYINEIQIDSILLSPMTGVRGLFIAKLSPAGEVIWAKDVNSTDEQVITHLVVDTAFRVYACGYFGGTFMTDAVKMVATAENDMMVLQFSESGLLQQAYQAGTIGRIQAEALSLGLDGNQINISGIYKGVVDFGGETIQTNTNDFDVFVIQLNSDFEVQWARKAGGVFEDNNTTILTDVSNNIYVLGDFQGVLKLDESIEITTNGIQDYNLYIIKYNENGIPLFARSLGGTNFDFVTDATWTNSKQIAAIGYYQNDLQMDNFALTALGNANTFTVGISSEDGAVDWLEGLEGSDLVIGNNLTNLHDQLVIGGVFNANLFSNNEDIESMGSFDGFIQYYDPVLTPTLSISKDSKILFYPNPASHRLFVQYDNETYTYQVDLYAISGQLIRSYTHPTSIDLQSVPSGMYLLYFNNNAGSASTRRLWIQKY